MYELEQFEFDTTLYLQMSRFCLAFVVSYVENIGLYYGPRLTKSFWDVEKMSRFWLFCRDYFLGASNTCHTSPFLKLHVLPE